MLVSRKFTAKNLHFDFAIMRLYRRYLHKATLSSIGNGVTNCSVSLTLRLNLIYFAAQNGEKLDRSYYY